MMTNGQTRKILTKDKEMDHIARFCPSTEEDFPEEIHSPTDSSEDSVEVKVEAISIRNKRKCAEPRRVQEGPLKKRMCLQSQVQPFRPWSRESATGNVKTEEISVSPTCVFLPTSPIMIGHHLTHHPMNYQEHLIKVPEVSHAYFRPPSPIKRSPSPVSEPVALVKRKDVNTDCDKNNCKIKIENDGVNRVPTLHAGVSSDDLLVSSDNVRISGDKIRVSGDLGARVSGDSLRVPMHPQVSHMGSSEADKMLRTSADAFPRLQQTRKEQRNYKNMTRERRIEANARERTRVHTISAAFDTLRRAIPAYSHSQKLSKLSVLRVACSYIMTLSNMLQDDQSELQDCVEQVTKTIQREGKLRKKKDESD